MAYWEFRGYAVFSLVFKGVSFVDTVSVFMVKGSSKDSAEVHGAPREFGMEGALGFVDWILPPPVEEYS